ncbi:glycosyl transferase [Enterovibrio norvegicus]|uniref:glycosyltransferase n=1 Tax=Enterovibrio norvegicus TaxID=188144 RepID=UPI0002FCB11C|nr:glycosyltransferase [Enterovibrio norvegicus]OEE45659.1 glycosyl transferase [Enterovibrio norvegicus]
MTEKIQASVIVAFYNKIELLKIVLSALNNQYDGSFNVVIADDGSRSDVVNEISSLKTSYKFELIHLWQADNGFRKNKILNQAVLHSNEYLIFTDGDCIPQRNFVLDHLINAQEGYCLNGRRADLSETVSKKINLEKPETFFKRHIKEILIEYMFGRGKNIEKGFRINISKISDYLNRKEKGIVGCNFSLFRNDILKINGFDERYEAAGTGEDSDVEFRLRLAGVRIKNIFFKANQIHIYHKELPRSPDNDNLFSAVKESEKSYTPFGIKRQED